MGACCPGSAKKKGAPLRGDAKQGGYDSPSDAVQPDDPHGGAPGGELSPLHSKSRPTLLGGQKDSRGLYKVPESREYLNLSCEDRTEWPVFSNVQVVRRLDLSQNKLQTLRPDPKTALAQWVNLEALNLSCNGLRDVPAALRDLPALTSLDVSGNLLRRPDGHEVCSTLSQLKTLCVLSLAECRLDALPRGVASCGTLTDLDLSGNVRIVLRRNGAEHGIQQLSRLEKLNLSRCQLRSVPTALRGCDALHTLDMSECVPWLDAQPFLALRDLNVSTLILKNDPRTHQGYSAIPPQLKDVRSLTSLDLSGNAIRSLDDVTAMPSLSTLTLWKCGIRRLHEPLLQSTGITSLDLTGNSLSADSIQCLRGSPLSRGLRCLNLCGNMAAHCVTYKSMDVVGELPELRDFWFDVWADKKNAREEKAVIYSSRVPAQLARPHLELLNGVPCRDFDGSLAASFRTVLKSGSLKLDFGIRWEDETIQHLDLLLLFHNVRDRLVEHAEASVIRYQLYLQWVMASGPRGGQSSFRANGEEDHLPPLDVLYILYCHILRPQQYAADMARNGLRLVNHLPYLTTSSEDWTAGRADSVAQLLSPDSRYAASAQRWNDRFAAKDRDSWLRYEWFLTDTPQGETPEPAPTITLSCDLAEEARLAMEFVDLAIDHADQLRSHWYFSRDRYMKFFCLRMLCFEKDRGGAEPPVPVPAEADGSPPGDEDDRWCPTIGIQLTAHIHQCLPPQYRHDMLWYAGRFVGCEAPPGDDESDRFQAALEHTSTMWREAFDEEYLSEESKLAGRPWGTLVASPRGAKRKPQKTLSGSALRRGPASSGSLLDASGAEDRLRQQKVRFAGGCG